MPLPPDAACIDHSNAQATLRFRQDAKTCRRPSRYRPGALSAVERAAGLTLRDQRTQPTALFMLSLNLSPSRRCRIEFNRSRRAGRLGSLHFAVLGECNGVNRLKTECYNEYLHRDYYSHISRLRFRSCLAACARLVGAGRAAQHLHVSVVDSSPCG